jgi:IS4 transposase
MKYPVRLIETKDSQGNTQSIIINDAKMSAQEISDLYRNRWQIELFFKWMKQHLIIKKCYGKSANAVYCLTLLMKKKVSYQGTLLDMFEFIEEYWSSSFFELIKELFKTPDRSSCGRRQINMNKFSLKP